MRIEARKLIAFTILLALSLLTAATADGQEDKKERPKGTPVLWRAPGNIAARDLYLGPGGAAMKPDLRRLTFIEEVEGGHSTKYRVRDASGRVWVAKIGNESQSETAATRLLWAVGYFTEITYLAPRVNIRGKGNFQNVRFEARPKDVERLDEWDWEDNPFEDTREFQGLKVMMALFNNWDLKDSNNEILLARNRGTGKYESRYIISDLGATFGKTGSLPLLWRLTRSRSKPEDYREAKFIDEVKGDRVDFYYGGKKRELFDDITVEQARWIGGWLSRLSDRQVRDAFRAANYSREEIGMLTRAVRERINDLVRLPKYEP